MDACSSMASGCSKQAFSALFRERTCPSRCFVEATPNNLWDLSVATKLRLWATPHEAALARFLVILRHPASRDLSFFNHAVRRRQGHAPAVP